MRTAFIEQLVEEARINDKIFLIVGDLGYNVVEPFANKFPDRFLNAGIAEQNMMGVAAGLANEGYIVYVYSIGNFPTLRCIEQIRNDICYPNYNVRIVSVGAGLAYGESGVSHHATEDIGMLRCLPNMIICSPSDPLEARIITKLSANKLNGPMYIRLGKAGERTIHKMEIDKLNKTLSQKGSPLPIIESRENTTAVISSGSISRDILDEILDLKLPYNLYTLPFIKPLRQDNIINIAKFHSMIITIEEHQLSCGIGSAIIECLSDAYYNNLLPQMPKIQRKAIPDVFNYLSGTQRYLCKKHNLSLLAEYYKKRTKIEQ